MVLPIVSASSISQQRSPDHGIKFMFIVYFINVAAAMPLPGRTEQLVGFSFHVTIES